MTKKILKTRAYYVDTFGRDSSHEMFNSALILMCAKIFDIVECKVEKSAFEVFKNIVEDEIPINLEFNKIFVVEGNTRLRLFLRYLVSSIQNLLFLFLSPKDAIIIFPFNNLFSLRLINSVNRVLKRKIIIFCHNEMEAILVDFKEKKNINRIFPWLCRNFFLNSKVKISEGIYFSVMGDILKKNLSVSISSDKLSKFICIDHPYIFRKTNYRNNVKSNRFNIGTVGALNQAKGLDNFVSFLNGLPSTIKNKVKVSVTGPVVEGIETLTELGVDILPKNRSLKRKDFDQRVQKLDLLLFFYPQDNYKVTASGAIMDAISHEKEILALRNDYFEYMFNKFGTFGYLAENIESMLDRFTQIIEIDKSPEIDFEKLKNKLTPDAISLQLLNELRRIKYLI